MPLVAGTRLGSHETIAPLGAGGMGEVYRARDTRLKREVAIKVLLEEVASSPERLARFEREATTVAGLNHRNIVILHSIEEAQGTRFRCWPQARRSVAARFLLGAGATGGRSHRADRARSRSRR